ncbi:MAG: hypothetical protein FWF00_04575 [Endomicrobia bacterium]|nr:hypothetical protein [Endomicrobiia bacterium]MCL2506945.1 hypothetical protein [Endomicrobiia bacterium]
MMKKTALVMAVMFALSSIGFAGGMKGEGKGKQMDPEQKAKMEAKKAEKAEYFKNLEVLIEKYNNAAEKDKAAIKKEVTNLVTKQQDKRIASKKDEVSKLEKNKTADINKKVEFLLSEEGQAKMQKMKEKGNKEGKGEFKKGKGGKKDFKKNKAE